MAVHEFEIEDMIDYAFSQSNRLGLPCILTTDDAKKVKIYEHFGMKMVREHILTAKATNYKMLRARINSQRGGCTMVTLREEIEIKAPFERLCHWADNFEEEFVKWSPLHLECQYLSGGIGKGDRVRFNECVMGLDYDVTGTIIERGRRIVFALLLRAIKRPP